MTARVDHDLTALDRAALTAIAQLPPDTPVQVTLRAGDLARALERRATAGPEILDAKQAAERFGYAAERWRRWCERGLIAGAWQDAKAGPWRLPRASCEVHLRRLQGRGARSDGVPATARTSRRQPHGPRRKSGTTRSEGGTTATGTVLPLIAGEPRAARPHTP